MPDAPKNYITPTGIAAMRAELDQLRRVERPEVVATVSWAAGNGDRSENVSFPPKTGPLFLETEGGCDGSETSFRRGRTEAPARD